MAKKSSKRPLKRRRRPAKSKDVASRRFVGDVMVRGEAAKPGTDGKLPLHATHVITRESEDGTVEVQRARFKAF